MKMVRNKFFKFRWMIIIHFLFLIYMKVTGRHILLEVSEEDMHLKNGRIYELSLRFPWKIIKESAVAEFDVDNRKLTIKVEVRK